MLSEGDYDCTVVNNLFAILSEDDEFPEGLYGYGDALIRGKIGGGFQKVEKAISLFHRASLHGHEGTKLLLLGTLPFKREVYCITRVELVSCIRILENCMRRSDDSCSMNRKNVDKLAFCLAEEYFSGKSAFLGCNKEKTREILESRNLLTEWSVFI